MTTSRRWTRLAAHALTAIAVLAAAQAAGLAALAARDGRAAVLAGLAAACALGAGGGARALRRGRGARLPAWLLLWACAAVAAVGAVGGLYRPGARFWWTALAAVLSWLAAGLWVGRRVVREAREAPDARASAHGDDALEAASPAGVGEALPNESLQLTEARTVPRGGIDPVRASAAEPRRSAAHRYPRG